MSSTLLLDESIILKYIIATENPARVVVGRIGMFQASNGLAGLERFVRLSCQAGAGEKSVKGQRRVSNSGALAR